MVSAIDYSNLDTLKHNDLSLNRRRAMEIWTCTTFYFSILTSIYAFSSTFLHTMFGYVARMVPSLQN